MFRSFPKILILIFLLALILRLLYFPGNINFTYDQARDSFAVLDVLYGHLKIVGPPTTISDKIFHGVWFYYLIAPIYFLFNKNPEAAVFLLRVLNAVGILIIFLISKNLFNNKIGLIAAFLFAISFEQTQYSLFFGHPSLGVISVLIYYLGLSWWIFKNNPYGFILALLGLGITLQFEDVNGLLILSLLIYLAVFYKKLKLLNLSIILLGLVGFLLAVSSFILAEIKYHFRATTAVISLITRFHNKTAIDFGYIISVVSRFLHDNFLNIDNPNVLMLIFISLILWSLKQKDKLSQIIFLLIWFFTGLFPHLLSPHNFSYYYSPGATVSLLILVSFLIYQVNLKNKFLAISILSVITISNLGLITTENYRGPNSDIVIQSGMILRNQLPVLDYIYQRSQGQYFAVNALTVPLNVNTTWSYLFQWYGRNKYGYLPVWGGNAALGFPGNLKIETNRSNLPKIRFTIMEPTVGIGDKQKEDFFKEENYFTKVVEERQFGTIKVQLRKPY